MKMPRGIEWSHLIEKCSQNWAFALIVRKNWMSARLLAKPLKLLPCSDFLATCGQKPA